MTEGKQLLSDIKFYDGYSKYREDKGRKETWAESVKDVMNMHREKFKDLPALVPYLNKAEKAYKNKEVLASQRNLQFRGEQIQAHNARIFNCSSLYIDRIDAFRQTMYLLLCGCGVGISVEKRFIDRIPSIYPREDKTITWQIPDSIEGWATALDKLLRSFFEGSEKIRFDYSLIRPKGAMISGGYKAPGSEPLKKSLELIETILEDKTKEGSYTLTSLDCHDIICISSDAVLAGGIRRSAILSLFDKDDKLMLGCKTGDWFYTAPWRARANNSIKLLKGSFTQEEFNNFKETIKQFGEPGIVLVDDLDFCTNPCCEIGFIPVNPSTGNSAINLCNLNEINGGLCDTPEKFYKACRDAAILGTLQASYTDFPFLGRDTEELCRLESLIGISITGIMDNPQVLLNPEVLQRGVEIIKSVNEEVAEIISINPAARLTCIKPSGNASVLLGTSSGIHPAHSKRYFRIMQMNKDSEVAKALQETNPRMIEESVWSANNSDYAAYFPIEEAEQVLSKDEMSDIDFLKSVKTVYENWVKPGTISGRGYSDRVTHNVSNTITVQNWDKVFDYIWDNQESFCGLSFMAELGDKVYKQAPFTKVMTFEEIIKVFGEGALFASGLIVDALHAFNSDLWDACEALKNRDFKLEGSRMDVLLKKDIVRRIKKFSKNYMKNNINRTIDCLKNIHIFHKYITVSRELTLLDFDKLNLRPTFVDIDTIGAVACSGGACEIKRI